MKLTNARILLASITLGLIITFITKLFNNTPSNFVGATWYGYPLPWIIKMVVAPQYNPWKLQPVNFMINVVFWFVISGIILLIGRYLLVPGKKHRRR